MSERISFLNYYIIHLAWFGQLTKPELRGSEPYHSMPLPAVLSNRPYVMEKAGV